MVKARLGIHVETGIVRVAAVRFSKVIWTATAAWNDEDDLAAAIGALAVESPIAFGGAIAAIGGRSLHLKTVNELPPLSARELRAHVNIGSARYFVADGPVVTDAAWLDAPGRAAVMAAVSAVLADAVCRGAVSAGLGLRDIVPAPMAMRHMLVAKAHLLTDELGPFAVAIGCALGPERTLSLLPVADRAKWRALRIRTWRRVGAIAAVLVLVVAGVHVAALAWSVRQLRGHLAAVAPRATRALSIRGDLNNLTAAVHMLESWRSSPARILPMLTGLARSLPDSSFLTRVTVDSHGTVLVAGFAKEGAAVSAAIEHVPGAGRPTLDGALAKEDVGGARWDRFGVRFQLARAGSP